MNSIDQTFEVTENREIDAVVTICSLNYLYKATVLLKSFKKFHPNDSLYLLIVDKKRETFLIKDNYFDIIWVEDLMDDSINTYAFTFDVLEFNTNVKPEVLNKLLKIHNKVIYLDPDIQVFAPLVVVKEALNKASIVITPHYTKPLNDNNKPNDLDLLKFGAYNLGFIGVSKCDEAFSFLNWWGERCLEYGFYEPQSGLGVDQKFIDLAPSFFPNLRILRNPGLNVAFWNLHERILSEVSSVNFVNDEYPLIFFHFSSFSENNPENIASKQSRFKKGDRPDVKVLFNGYAKLLKESEFYLYRNEQYGFDSFDDGMYISPMLRRVYSILEDPKLKNDNPFLSTSNFRKYAKNLGLLNIKSNQIKRYTFKDMNQFNKQESIILFGLRFLLRLVGPNRYFNFMRYLGYISSIRNQHKIFNK